MVASGEEVRQMVKDVRPRPIRRYYVEINGTQFPAKQVLERLLEAKRVGLFAADVTSRDANRVLRALGFEVMALSNQGGE
ncbi:MAG: hypothetical protein QGF81_07085 [Dehalococcoidia bacterium]|nr:hypothetical protein [Dehalococcoidia bacterium]